TENTERKCKLFLRVLRVYVVNLNFNRKSQIANRKSPSCQRNKTLRILPFTKLRSIHLAHVYQHVPIGVDADGVAFQRTRRRAFEVHTRDVITGAVTGTFELLLALQPTGDASEVRAGG